MALFRKETPEEKKLKELVGGSNLSPEFTLLMEENNLVRIHPSKKDFAAGYNIRDLLKRKIKNKEISVEEIEPELNLMIKKAKYIIENFELINFCPKCGKKLSKHNIFICKCGNNLLDEYEFPKLNNKEIQQRKRLINIVNNDNKINLIKKHDYSLIHVEVITESKKLESGLIHENKIFFDYPSHYTKIDGEGNIICILSRKLDNDEQIEIEISMDDHSGPIYNSEYYFENNKSAIKISYWHYYGKKIYFKGETENNIVNKLYYYYLKKVIIVSSSIPLNKYSNYIESHLLNDLKIISRSFKSDWD